jgi:hypothetical protein
MNAKTGGNTMTITIPPELAKRLEQRAAQFNTDLESLALDHLLHLATDEPGPARNGKTLAEIQAKLDRLAKPMNVSLPDSAFSREELYD